LGGKKEPGLKSAFAFVSPIRKKEVVAKNETARKQIHEKAG